MKQRTITELQLALAVLSTSRAAMFQPQRQSLPELFISRQGQPGIGLWRRSEHGFTVAQLGYSIPTHHAMTVEAAVQVTQSLVGSN